MIETKLIELRDHGTFVPALAIRVTYENDGSRPDQIIGRCWFRSSGIYLLHMGQGGRCNYDPYEWGDRTFTAAHNWLVANWDSIQNGGLLDVRVVIGEMNDPCASELREPPP